jgi:uncharacterized membrane protein YuzA (DUF378 family)
MSGLFALFLVFVYLSIVGALNWGLVAIFNFDLVQFLSHQDKIIAKILYIVIALSALIALILSFVVASTKESYKNPEEELSQRS